MKLKNPEKLSEDTQRKTEEHEQVKFFEEKLVSAAKKFVEAFMSNEVEDNE